MTFLNTAWHHIHYESHYHRAAKLPSCHAITILHKRASVPTFAIDLEYVYCSVYVAKLFDDGLERLEFWRIVTPYSELMIYYCSLIDTIM